MRSHVPTLQELDGRLRSGARGAAALAREWGRQIRRAANTLGSGRRELVIMLMAYGAYSLVKGLAGGSLPLGIQNAGRIVDLERQLGIYFEPDLQRFFNEHGLGMPFWNALYVASQVIVLPLTFLLVFRYARRAYPFLRNTFFIAWTAGLVWYAPPARRAAAAGRVRVHRHGLQPDLLRPRLPLHPGLLQPGGGHAEPARRRRPDRGLGALAAHAVDGGRRALGIAYPLLVATAVVVTGNHFVLDVAGGLIVVLPAAVVARLLTGPPLALPSPIVGRRRAGGARTSG